MVNADWIEALIIDEVEQIDADGVVISRNDEQVRPRKALEPFTDSGRSVVPASMVTDMLASPFAC